jgi:nitrogen fixation NifU-like protein
MSDLRELYQEVILDHNRRPRNFRALDPPSQKAEGFNPLCGDKITVYLRVQNGVIEDVSFEGSGCAISKASASLMTDALKGRSLGDANVMFEAFHRMVTAPVDAPVDTGHLDKLVVFAGVREYPVRVKCASLAWHTLRAALEAKEDVISTE